MTPGTYVRAIDIYSNAATGKVGLLPISRSTWWEWVKRGIAPKPFKLGLRISQWRTADVLALYESSSKTPPLSPVATGESMNALNQAIYSDIARAFDFIGRVSHLRADARCKEIARLSGGAIRPSAEHVEHIAQEIRVEMIEDAKILIRQTIQFIEAKNSTPKV